MNYSLCLLSITLYQTNPKGVGHCLVEIKQLYHHVSTMKLTTMKRDWIKCIFIPSQSVSTDCESPVTKVFNVGMGVRGGKAGLSWKGAPKDISLHSFTATTTPWELPRNQETAMTCRETPFEAPIPLACEIPLWLGYSATTLWILALYGICLFWSDSLLSFSLT